MNPMIVCEATMLKHYEPGDGTRYRVMYSIGPKSVFVAIGAGDKIEGGYMLQRDMLDYYANEISSCESAETVQEEFGRFFQSTVGYWRQFGHAGMYDRRCPECDHVLQRTDVAASCEWTARVACMIALVAHASVVYAQYQLPGLVYRDRWEEVLTLVKEWRDD